MKKHLLLAVTGLVLASVINGCSGFSEGGPVSNNIEHQARALSSQAHNLDTHVVKLALKAYHKASKNGLAKKPILTVVDYSKPSTQPRLWVMDLRTNRVLYEELVAHGRGSGGNYATSFSNQGQSHQSSIGTYITRNPYVGGHGKSLRLDGLDKGFNDRAQARAVVVHGAPYVSSAFAKRQGRLGLSWGCFALDQHVSARVIDTIKNGTLLFAYYPDHRWLSSSKYLQS